MTERWRNRDVQIQLFASVGGALIGALAGAAAGGSWWTIGAMAGFVMGNAALKLLQPSNSIFKDESWVAFLAPGVLVLIALFLFHEPHLLGGWTIIVVFGIFFVYGLVSLIVSARRPGDANHRGANDGGAD